MQSRRRWSAVAGMILVGTGATLVQARDPAADAKSMMALHGSDAVTLRTQVLDDLNKMPVVKKDQYVGQQMLGGSALKGPWAQLLAQTENPDAQLNAAITIAMAKTLSTDAALENVLLPSPNAAVRYWGAKGLDAIMPELVKVSAAVKGRALSALNKTIAKETSGVVKQEIIRALGEAGDVPALETASESLASQLQASAVDHETIDAAGTALIQVDALVKKGAAVDKAKAAKAAAWIANFAAQQLVAYKARLGGSDVPEAYSNSVFNTISSATNLLNDLTGKNSFQQVARTADPNELQLNVDEITGSASVSGKLQKVLPGVPAPPSIKKPS